MHGNDSREYKFYPKVLGIAVDVLEEDKNFNLTNFMKLLKEIKPVSIPMTDNAESLVLEQIKIDIRAEKWGSLQ